MTPADAFAALHPALREALLFWVAHVFKPAMSRSPVSTYETKAGFEQDSGNYVSNEALAGAFLALDFHVERHGRSTFYPYARPVVRRNDLPLRTRWAVRRDSIRHQTSAIRSDFDALVARTKLRAVRGGAR